MGMAIYDNILHNLQDNDGLAFVNSSRDLAEVGLGGSLYKHTSMLGPVNASYLIGPALYGQPQQTKVKV